MTKAEEWKEYCLTRQQAITERRSIDSGRSDKPSKVLIEVDKSVSPAKVIEFYYFGNHADIYWGYSGEADAYLPCQTPNGFKCILGTI